MARAGKLKVYRTAIGFHDAYVAAPSQKAALAAWGTDTNLFARGLAELVTDDALTREPLAHPGAVIRRSRGTLDEQLAALPPDRPRSDRKEADDDTAPRRKRSAGSARSPAKLDPPRKAKPKPRPSRDTLDQAEQDLAALLADQEGADAALREREQALAKERRAFERDRDGGRRDAERRVEAARRDHVDALARWRQQR